MAGLGLAWALARRGATRVTVIEQEDRCFALSSSHNAAILRTAIDSPATRALTRRTAGLLRTPPSELCAAPLVDDRGLFVLEGHAGSPEPWWAEELQESGEVVPMAPDEASKRSGGLTPEGTRAWWFREGGTIQVDALGAGLEQACRGAGVTLELGRGVRAITRDTSDGVRGVELEDGTEIAGDAVVLAAGAWAGALGSAVGAAFPGRPTRRHLFVTSADPRIDPTQPIAWDDAAPFYIRPEDGGLLVCVGDMDDCLPAGSSRTPLPMDALVVRSARRALTTRLPHLEGLRFVRGWAAVRTLTEDDTPVLGWAPEVPGLFWCAALGGHGMSLSLGLAEFAAELLLGECTDVELAARLAPGAPRRAWQPRREWGAAT